MKSSFFFNVPMSECGSNENETMNVLGYIDVLYVATTLCTGRGGGKEGKPYCIAQ